jgi:hypothetical protein
MIAAPNTRALLAAYCKASKGSKGKRYRTEVFAFGATLEAELVRLRQELCAFTSAPGRPTASSRSTNPSRAW